MKTKSVKDQVESPVTPVIDNEKLISDAQKRVDDLKAQLSEAKDQLRKLSGKKTSEPKGPGVISTILDLVTNAPKTGVSKDEILAKLVEMFPDRTPEAMKKTINVQLPARMSKERNVKIEKLDTGHFHVVK